MRVEIVKANSKNEDSLVRNQIETEMLHDSGATLGDGDLAAMLGLLELRNHDAEDAVLHGSMDSILINTDWEAEATRELANAPFRNPVFGLRLLWLLLSLSDFGCGALHSVLILDGSLASLAVVIGLTALSDGASRSGTLDEASRRGTGGIRTLGTALDCQCLGIGELDLNILLLNAWKFSMKFVGVGNLLDIEIGAEGLQVRAVMTTLRNVATRVLIEVIEKSEEGGEGSVRIACNKRTREERHVACRCSCVDDGCCWWLF